MTNQQFNPFASPSPSLWGKSRGDGRLVLVDRDRYIVRPRGCRRVMQGLAVLLLAGMFVLIAGWRTWLGAMGEFLIYGEAPAPADAIIVLGGGYGSRVALGAELYKEGYAPVVIASEIPLYAVTDPAKLRAAGVPVSAIHALDDPSTTYEEALLTRDMLEDMGVQRVILVTDNYHSRRARAIFTHVYKDVGIEVISVPAEPDWFDLSNWWDSEIGVRTIVDEYLKLGWFWLGGHG